MILAILGCSRTSSPVWIPGWEEVAPMINSRTAAKAVVVGGHIYVIGGGKGTPAPGNIHRSVEYTRILSDGRLDSWKITSALNTPRMFLATVQVNGVIYALGGEDFPKGQMTLLNSVEHAVVKADGSLGPWVESSPMLTPRRSPTAAVSDDYLYAIGGYNGTFLRAVERARILSGGEPGSWEAVPQPLTTARYIHGGATIQGRIYVVGGHIQDSGRGSSGAEWTTVRSDGQLNPWNTTSSLHQPRFLAGSAITDDYILIIGGYDGGYLASVEQARIQPDGNLGPWIKAASLSTPREGAAVAVHQNHIYVIGGSNKGQYLRTVAHAQLAEDGTLGYWKTN